MGDSSYSSWRGGGAQWLFEELTLCQDLSSSTLGGIRTPFDLGAAIYLM